MKLILNDRKESWFADSEAASAKDLKHNTTNRVVVAGNVHLGGDDETM